MFINISFTPLFELTIVGTPRRKRLFALTLANQLIFFQKLMALKQICKIIKGIVDYLF